MNKRKSCLYTILMVIVLIIFLSLYYFVKGIRTWENIYYIPQGEIYLKTIYKPYDNRVYVFFNKNKNTLLTKENDYIILYAKNGLGILTRVLIEPFIFDKIYLLPDKSGSDLIEINQVNYNIKEVQYEGCIYYEDLHFPDWLEIENYLQIYIGERGNNIYISEPGDSILKELFPIQK